MSETAEILTSALEILEKAAAIYSQSRAEYRDGLLKVGAILHDFVLAHLREGDRLMDQPNGEKYRLEGGFTRRRAIHIAEERLRRKPGVIQNWISAAMVVDLLSKDRAVGPLSYGAILLFSRFIQRRIAGIKHLNGKRVMPGRLGYKPSEGEQWMVRPQFDGRAQTLFQQAVSEEWEFERCRAAVLPLYDESPSKLGSTARKRRRKADRGPQGGPASQGAEAPSSPQKGPSCPPEAPSLPPKGPSQAQVPDRKPSRHFETSAARIKAREELADSGDSDKRRARVRAGSPRDVAEYLFGLALESDDPPAVVAHLKRMAEEYQPPPRRLRSDIFAGGQL